MKEVLLITNYWHFFEEKESSRYRSLANLIVQSGLSLEVCTSTFYHATKKQRNKNDIGKRKSGYDVNLVYEPGYKDNISLTRILSHKIFAINVFRYLKKRKKPDVIICVVPSLDVANLVSKYAQKNKIPLIIDIQDLWPEAYKIAFDMGVFSDFIYFPFKRKARKIYSRADELTAVSKTYVDFGLKYNNKIKHGTPIYIGVELDLFDQYFKKPPFYPTTSKYFNIVYVGSLGYSYDLELIIDAIEILSKNYGYKNIKFLVAGDGPRRNHFVEYARSKQVDYIDLGNLPYDEMVSVLKSSDIAVNPIVSSSYASIINKHADYFAAGLPVINTQNSKEYINLLERFKAGVSCVPGEKHCVAQNIKLLIENDELRNSMARNSREVAERKFDRNVTYQQFINIIKKVV